MDVTGTIDNVSTTMREDIIKSTGKLGPQSKVLN